MWYVVGACVSVGVIIGIMLGIYIERHETLYQPSYEYIIEGGQINHINIQVCDGHHRPVEIIETAHGSAFYICGRKVER